MSPTLFFSRLLPCAMFRSPSFRRRNNKDPIWAMPDSTGYGHSSYGGGHSSYGSDHSGYGHGDDYGHYETIHCCPLTIDPYTWTALLSFIALATWLLNETIQMSMLMMARKRRKRTLMSFKSWPEIVWKGRTKFTQSVSFFSKNEKGKNMKNVLNFSFYIILHPFVDTILT